MALNLTETFTSILGESTLAGLPGFFIRLTGCNLRCAWCDTTYAYEGGGAVAAAELAAAARASGTGIVVVTGGEPLLQADTPALLTALADAGLSVLLETNGSRPLAGVDPRVRRVVDLKCPGSGMAAHNYLPNLDLLTPADELKLVLAHRQDFEFALDLIVPRRLWERLPVLLSPVFGVLPPADLAAWIVEAGLPLRLQLQLHKYIWGPEARGV